MDTIRSQLAVKNQCEHLKKSIKELYDWEEQIKKPGLAMSQPVEHSPLPPVRSNASAMNEFYQNRKTAEKLDRTDEGEAVDQMQLADAEVLKDRGNKQCKLGNFRDAIKLYSEAIEIYEDNPVYYSNRALCYMNIELYENCLADCNIALQKDPTNVKAYYRRMQAYERLGENAKALSECRKILNISQDDNERNVTKRDMARIEKRLAEQQAAWTAKGKDSTVGTDSTLSLVKKEADKYKELGNKLLAEKEFQKAETCYTQAISMFENEAIFYTNRSICYWHLKDYENCLADCNKAILLDESYFRPYYRRMLVREHLGSFQGAIEDCKKFLDLAKDDKQKATAMKDLLRLERLMKSEKPAKQAFVWSQVKKNAKPTKFIQKPPHLRSKVALKRIAIEDIHQNPVMAPVSSGISVKREPVPDAIIDKIFNNNTGEQLMDPEESTTLEHLFPVHSNKLKNLFSSSKTLSDAKKLLSPSISNIKESVGDTKTRIDTKSLIDSPTNDKIEFDKISRETQVSKAKQIISPTNSLLSIPNSIGQFYTTWSGLNEELKYLYLKLLKDVPLNKLFGAGLSNEMLGELLYIMQTRFIPDKIDVTNIMLEIAKNECINILSLLLNCNDRKAINELLKYMETQNASEKDIQQIRTKIFRD